MDARLPYPPGTRAGDRPAAVKPCSTCGELSGRGYPSCLGCAELVDGPWLADWVALVAAERLSAGTEGERELADRVLDAPTGTYAWTCVDWALRLSRCAECGGELGAGDPVCLVCGAADAERWAWFAAAPPDAVTPGERALRLAVTALRGPHRRRESVVATWRLAIPFVLAGEPVADADLRAIRTAVIAGRYADLAALDRVAELVTLPLLPWRRSPVREESQ